MDQSTTQPTKDRHDKKNKQTDQQITQLQSQVSDYKDKLARTLADYDNLEKRVDTQRQLIATLTVATIVDKLLTILDDLYLTYNHLQDQGLKITIDKFITVLKNQGVEEINALNQKFDPTAMDCVEVTIGEPDKVLEVRKKGYKLNGQVIRPTQVVVGKKSENTA